MYKEKISSEKVEKVAVQMMKVSSSINLNFQDIISKKCTATLDQKARKVEVDYINIYMINLTLSIAF